MAAFSTERASAQRTTAPLPDSTVLCRLPGITGSGSGWRGPQLSLRWCLCLNIKPGPWINLGKWGEREERKKGGGERESMLRKKTREDSSHISERLHEDLKGMLGSWSQGWGSPSPAYFPRASERTLKGEALPAEMEFTSLFLCDLTLKDASW